MKKLFTFCMSMLLMGTAYAQIVTDEELDESFVFTDLEGNEVANGSTIVVTELNEEGQMVIPLKAKNASGEKVAVSMYEDLSQKPNGEWQTCAFGNCMSLSASGYSPKNIMAADYNAEIETEWMPTKDSYATWEAKLQIHIFNITKKTQFGKTIESAGNEVIGYGPVVTVRFEYKDPNAQPQGTTVKMGSYSTDDYSTQGSGLHYYVSGATTVTIYQKLTLDDVAMFNGATVKQLRVAFALDQTKASKVFIAPINKQGGIGDNLAEVTIDSPKKGWNTADLATPYTIDTSDFGGLVLGFTYTQTNANNGQSYNEECFPLSILGSGPHPYTILVKGLNNTNYGLSASNLYSIGSGNLSVQAIVEGEFKANAGRFFDYSSIVLRPGETKDNTIILHNMGTEAIKNLSYVTVTDGVSGEEKTISVDESPAFNEYGEVAIPFAASDKMGTEVRTITLTKVNGVANEIDVEASAANGLVATTDRVVKKRVAVEEYTGTGCPWCPRGIVGMELMRKTFPDDIVGIALHQYNSSDAMFIPYSDYADLSFSGAPSCMIDRQAEVDPYYGTSNESFGIKNTIEAALTQQPLAAVDVKGEWTDENTVKATATVESLVNGENYSIEFVLVADELSGTGSGWNQGNNYAGQSVGGDLADFCKGGKYGKSSVSGLKFNDVAIASSYTNYENQASPILKASDSEAVESTFTLALPTKAALRKAIKNENVWVVALLINQWTGFVENAAKFHMPAFEDLSGIVSTEASTNDKVAERYSLDGRQLPAAQKGLNILRMGDGSVRKIVVK